MSKRGDVAERLAAKVFPYPDKWSSGEEDTWNSRRRKRLARAIRCEFAKLVRGAIERAVEKWLKDAGLSENTKGED